MKKIDRLILKSFLGPLLLTFVIAVFVLLMQFLWRYVDDLVGKGLEFSVIAELLLYAAATFVPMALPIAILLASIMTMGNFGEKYELVAMKAGGISLSRAMRPLVIVSLLLTITAFFFANNVMPNAMLKYRMTLYDITRKKPAINIRAGEYFKEIDGYVIKVGEKGQDGRTLKDIVIYDHTKGLAEANVIVAKYGTMQTTPDNNYLIFSLYDGFSYSEQVSGKYYHSRPLTTIGFSHQTIAFDVSSFAYNKSGENLFQGSYHMMNVTQLDSTINALKKHLEKRYGDYREEINGALKFWDKYCKVSSQQHIHVDNCERYLHIDNLDPMLKLKVSRTVNNCANSAKNDAKIYDDMVRSDHEYINRHYIEWHRKFTLSVACLLLFLIGAPFGSIVRKGGLGLPLVASVGVFVLYYMIGMIGEKAVRESAIGPEGMWISTIVLLPIGLILTLQATTDSSFFDASSWKKNIMRFSSKFVRKKR
ncbi:MAG: LptF/LptG family permease [Bacteroidales bacterium]|nr:LptF/LptG family permease [Bacteroidales bacterium]